MPKPRIGGNLFPSGGEGSGNAVRAILEGGRAMAAGITAAGEGVSRGIINKKNYERGKAEAEKERGFRATEAEKGRTAAMEREKFSQDRADARAAFAARLTHSKELAAEIHKRTQEIQGLEAIIQDFESRGVDASQFREKLGQAENTAGALMGRMLDANPDKYDPTGIADIMPQAQLERDFQRAGAETAKSFMVNDLSALRRRKASSPEAEALKRTAMKKGMDNIAMLEHKMASLNARDRRAEDLTQLLQAKAKQEAGVKKNMNLYKPVADYLVKSGLMDEMGRSLGEGHISEGGTWKDAIKISQVQLEKDGKMTPEVADAFVQLHAAQSRPEIDAALKKLKALQADPDKVVGGASTAYGRVGVMERNTAAANDSVRRADEAEIARIGASIEKAMYKPAKQGKDKELRDPVGVAQRLLPTMDPKDTAKFLMSGRATTQQRQALMYLLRMQLSEQYATQGLTGEELVDKVEADLSEIEARIGRVYAGGK